MRTFQEFLLEKTASPLAIFIAKSGIDVDQFCENVINEAKRNNLQNIMNEGWWDWIKQTGRNIWGAGKAVTSAGAHGGRVNAWRSVTEPGKIQDIVTKLGELKDFIKQMLPKYDPNVIDSWFNTADQEIGNIKAEFDTIHAPNPLKQTAADYTGPQQPTTPQQQPTTPQQQPTTPQQQPTTPQQPSLWQRAKQRAATRFPADSYQGN